MMLLALGFGALLSSGSLSKSVTESYVSSFAISGAQSVRKIEFGLRYGKQLDNFIGMRKILLELAALNPAVREVQVVMPGGEIEESLVHTSQRSAPAVVTSALALLSRDTGQAMVWRVVDGQYHVLTAINDAAGRVQGALVIVFDAQVVAAPMSSFEKEIVQQTLAAVLLAVGLFIVFWKYAQRLHSPAGPMQSSRVLLFAIVLLGLIQGALTARTIALFKPVYAHSVLLNQRLVGEIVRKDLARVVDKGVLYAELYQTEAWMEDIHATMPEIERVLLGSTGIGPAQAPGYGAMPTEGLVAAQGGERFPALQMDLPADASGTPGYATIVLSPSFIDAKNREVVVDAVTLWVITILFSVEVMLLLGVLVRGPAVLPQPVGASEQRNRSLVRPQAFMLFLAISLSTSFLPVLLRGFEALPGMAVPVFLSLPLTVELLATLAATVLAGPWVDRHGWRFSLLIGLLLLAAGTCLSALASSLPVILLARLVVGCGYGLGWTALRGLVANSTMRGSDLAALNSGIYAGINCGVILGALLVGRISYAGIFLVSLLLLGCATVFCLVFTVAPHSRTVAPPPQAVPWLTLLRDRGVLFYLLAAAIPTAVCLMFLTYYVPVYARGAGLSASDVGRLFLLYGLVVVYLGPVLSRTVIPRYPFKQTSALGFLCAVLGLLAFGFFPSPLTCALAVALLGLADALGLVAQNHLFLGRSAVQAFGLGRATSLLGVVKKMGQALGAVLFAWAASATQGVVFLALTLALCCGIFMLGMPRAESRVSP